MLLERCLLDRPQVDSSPPFDVSVRVLVNSRICQRRARLRDEISQVSMPWRDRNSILARRALLGI